ARQSRKDQLWPSRQGPDRASPRRTVDAPGQVPHDGDSLSRQRARDQRSARWKYRSGAGLANKANIDAGKLKLLATGSRERLKDYQRGANIPETLPGVYADTWMAVAAPPGTPKEIAKKVSDAIRQGFQQSELRARILALEADPLASTPQEMRELIHQSLETWGPVVEAAKIVVE